MNEYLEKVHKVIESITEMETLKNALKIHKISSSKFFKMIHAEPKLETSYSLAQCAKTELIVEDIIEIADTDIDPQRARNRIDARKWYASKMKPNKFGDRLDINLNQTIDIRGVLEEAKRRALPDSDHSNDIITHGTVINDDDDTLYTDVESVESVTLDDNHGDVFD